MRNLEISFCVVLTLVLMGCSGEPQDKKSTEQSIKVETTKPYGGDLTSEFMGKIVAREQADQAFRIAGTIEEIPVKVGDMVRRGTVIARLDTRDYKTQLEATEAEHRQIKAEADRIIELYNRRSISQNDYDKAVSGLDRITSKLTAHRNAYADCALTAAINGRVQRINYHTGETVGAGMPVVSIISNDGFEIEIFVPAVSYATILEHKKSEYSCLIPMLSNQRHPLEFSSIAPKANANGLYAMRLNLPSAISDRRIAAGMSSTVFIQSVSSTEQGTPTEQSMVSIPFSAVFERDGRSFVWVYQANSNRVEAREVHPGEILANGRAVITSGLDLGEQIVTAGIHSISEDTPVKLLEAPSPTNIGGVK